MVEIKQPKIYECYGLKELEVYLDSILKTINKKVLDTNTKKIEIKSYWLVQDAHINMEHNGFYRPLEKTIKLHLELGITPKEITKTFLHELAHAYQHQIIPQYYKDIVRDTSNKVMHDKIFYQILEAFKSVILYSKISQIGNNNK